MKFCETAWQAWVPTYSGEVSSREIEIRAKSDFGPPHVPVIAYSSNGIRIVLGAATPEDESKPDIKLERRPHGWIVFLHPIGGSDASGQVFLHDNGHSYVRPEPTGPTSAIEFVAEEDDVEPVSSS